MHSTPGKGTRVQGQEVSGMENQGIILRWGSRALSPLLLGTADRVLLQHKTFQGHPSAFRIRSRLLLLAYLGSAASWAAMKAPGGDRGLI